MYPKAFYINLKFTFIYDANFSSWPGKSVNPYFIQYQSDTNNDRFTCCFENQLKKALIISILHLHPNFINMNLKLSSYLTFISPCGPVKRQPLFYPISIGHKQWQIYLLPQKSLKNFCNNIYLHRKVFKTNYDVNF